MLPCPLSLWCLSTVSEPSLPSLLPQQSTTASFTANNVAASVYRASFQAVWFLESKTEAHKHIMRNHGYALDLRVLPYQVSFKHFPSLAKVVYNHRPLQRTA